MGSDGPTPTHAMGTDATPPPRVLMPRSQRERLLHGMARTVARRGYAATSVADVLRVAGMSRRTFYELFADKEDCFLAAYDAIVAVCTERLIAAYAAETSWEAGLASAYDTLLGLLAAEPEFARLGIVEVLAAGPRGLARRDETVRRFVRFIDASRDDAGIAVAPPPLVGQAIVGGIYELLYSRIVQGRTATLPELADDLVHYTRMLLGVPPPAVP